jgi:predicted dehydrogenase
MSDPVRIAQIGAGGFGRFHLDTWKHVPEGRVVGLFDQSTSAAQAAAQASGVEQVYPTLEAALADEQVDAVTVIVPNRFHAEITIAALEAGKHVLCEKPLAPTAEAVRQMIAARDKTDRILMAGQHLRFDSRTRALHSQIQAGKLGQVYHAKAQWLRSRGLPATPGFMTRELAGFGPGADIGVHVLDLAMHLMDMPRPRIVLGQAGCWLAKTPGRANDWGPYDTNLMDVEDLAVAMITFSNGGTLMLEASWMLNLPGDERLNVELYGTEGGMHWPEMKLAGETNGQYHVGQIKSTRAEVMDGHANEFRAFCHAIQTGGPSPLPAEQSLVIAQILDALYASAKSGTAIELNAD